MSRGRDGLGPKCPVTVDCPQYIVASRTERQLFVPTVIQGLGGMKRRFWSHGQHGRYFIGDDH